MDDVAVIGDLVDSRRSADRARLHRLLNQTLQSVNRRLAGPEPAHITVGDEFQAVYTTLGDAILAAAVIRCRLTAAEPPADVRFGIGRGEVQILDADQGIRDGSAYWAARDAIVAVEERARSAATRTARTEYRVATEVSEDPTAVQAALNCLDFMIGSMSSASRTILGGLMAQQTQTALASTLGLSVSAVSQRVRRDGIGVVVASLTALAGLP